jgi:AbiTii
MPSLVEELQRDALEPSVDVSDLLRKALVVATKLKLDEFRQWAERELEGYDNPNVPRYRQFHGQVVIYHPSFGTTLPVLFDSIEQENLLSRHVERHPVGYLQEMLRTKGESSVLVATLPPAAQQFLLAQSGGVGVPQVHFQVTFAFAILDAVRNTILKWSLKLESEGIIGEGMSFSPAEKETAAREAPVLDKPVNYYIHVEGDMVNSTVQQGSPAATQTVSGLGGGSDDALPG